MRRRFQAGGVQKRGTRFPVWGGRYYKPVPVAGKLKKVRRAVVPGLCSETAKGEAKWKLQALIRPLNDGVHSPALVMTNEAELTFRRSAINLLEETAFGAHNQSLTDPNGCELGGKRFELL